MEVLTRWIAGFDAQGFRFHSFIHSFVILFFDTGEIGRVGRCAGIYDDIVDGRGID